MFTYSGGAAGLAEVAALSSSLHAIRGRDRDIVASSKLEALELVQCRPALTPRWTEKLGINPKMLTPTLTYINCRAKLQKA